LGNDGGPDRHPVLLEALFNLLPIVDPLGDKSIFAPLQS
jgi:hypothetical protein